MCVRGPRWGWPPSCHQVTSCFPTSQGPVSGVEPRNLLFTSSQEGTPRIGGPALGGEVHLGEKPVRPKRGRWCVLEGDSKLFPFTSDPPSQGASP